jgi:anti-sigma-K factor RskA
LSGEIVEQSVGPKILAKRYSSIIIWASNLMENKPKQDTWHSGSFWRRKSVKTNPRIKSSLNEETRDILISET